MEADDDEDYAAELDLYNKAQAAIAEANKAEGVEGEE